MISRDVLNKNPPPELEKRNDFVKRLHRAVKHLNTQKSAALKKIATNHWERCKQCVERKGGRTDY